MIYLIDTNVLLRILYRTDSIFPNIRFARYAPKGIVTVDPAEV